MRRSEIVGTIDVRFDGKAGICNRGNGRNQEIWHTIPKLCEKHGTGKIEEDDESKTKIAYTNKDLLTTAIALEMLTDRFYNLITDTTGLQITSYGKGRWLDPTDTQRHHYI